MATTLSTDEHAFTLLVVLLPIWLCFMGLLTVLFGYSSTVAFVATAFTFVPILIVATPPPELSFGKVFTYLWIGGLAFLAITLLGLAFAYVVRFTVVMPVISLIESAATHPIVAIAVVLGVAGISIGGVLFTVAKTGPTVDHGLVFRMVASLFVLALVTVWFLNTIWILVGVVVGIVSSPLGIEPGVQQVVAIIIMATLLATVVYRIYREFARFSPLDRHGVATPVSPAEFPALHSITTTVAAQLDIPMPTLAITEQSEAEAIAVGYRPGSIHLILSQGTLDILDEDELEAVIAHELAHVANTDAMVMTVASLPTFLAESFYDQFKDRVANIDSTNQTLAVFVVLYSYPFWGIMLLTTYLTQPFVAVLSRARESTADRTAATVTGSPATLASALSTLDDRIAKIPAEDLREASSLSSLSILPLDPIQTDPDSPPDPNSDSESLLAPLAPKWWWRVGWMLFATHPPTERRIAVLTALTEGQQRR